MSIINSTRISHGDDAIVVASHEDATISLHSLYNTVNDEIYVQWTPAKMHELIKALHLHIAESDLQRIRIETERAEAAREDRDEVA